MWVIVLLCLAMVGCNGPNKPQSGSARVVVASDSFADSVSAWLVVGNPPYPSLSLLKGQEGTFSSLALNTRYAISFSYRDSLGLEGMTRHFILGFNGDRADYYFTATGLGGRVEQ